MEWINILKELVPEIITILAVISTAILSYYKVVNWSPEVVESVLKKIAEAILGAEKYCDISSGAQKLDIATNLAIMEMNDKELKIMKQLGKKAKEKSGSFFKDAVQSVFTNSAKSLLEYGVKKGVDKIIGK